MKRTILVVDDEEPLRHSLKLILEAKGYVVATAADGRGAMAAIAELVPELVITDILMPHQAGIDTITRIKRDHPDTAVIAMSGGFRVNGQDNEALARKMGADACIEKPFRADKLLALISGCIDARDAAS